MDFEQSVRNQLQGTAAPVAPMPMGPTTELPAEQAPPPNSTLPEQEITAPPPPPNATLPEVRIAGGMESPAPRGPDQLAKLQAEEDALARHAMEAQTAAKLQQAQEEQAGIARAREAERQYEQSYEVGRQHMLDLNRKREAYLSGLERASIDPNRYFKSQGAMSMFGTGIAIVAGAILQARGATQVNAGMQLLEKSIDRDIDAQRVGLEKQLQVGREMGQLSSDYAAQQNEIRMYEAAKRQHFWDMTERTIRANALQRGVQVDQAQFDLIQKKIEEERLRARMAAQQAAASAALARADKLTAQRVELVKAAYQTAKESGADFATVAAAGQQAAGLMKVNPEKGPYNFKGTGGSELKGEERVKQITKAQGLDEVMKAYDALDDIERSSELEKRVYPPTTEKRERLRESLRLSLMKTGLASDKDAAAIIAAEAAPTWGDAKERAEARSVFVKKRLADIVPDAWQYLSPKYRAMAEKEYGGRQ